MVGVRPARLCGTWAGAAHTTVFLSSRGAGAGLALEGRNPGETWICYRKTPPSIVANPLQNWELTGQLW